MGTQGKEAFESARFITDSFLFCAQSRYVKYPGAEGPRNKDDDEVFAGYLALENRSLVWKTLDKPLSPVGDIFTGARDDCYANERKEPKKKVEEAVYYPYELVTEDELNAQYAGYMLNNVTAEEVMESVLHFVQRKIYLGTNEYKLRQRGLADDLLGPFYLKMRKAVENKMFTGHREVECNDPVSGNRPPPTFSGYVNTAWMNSRHSVYTKLDREDKRVVSSTLTDEDETDVGGNVISEAVSLEDQYAVKLHETSKVCAQEADAAKALLEKCLGQTHTHKPPDRRGPDSWYRATGNRNTAG